MRHMTNPVKLAWTAAIVLFAACWFLPIIEGSGKKEYFLGFEGARFAHEKFWALISGGSDTPKGVAGMLFVAIGWPANELFIAGLLTVAKWPRASLRIFAAALGIMVSWQVGFHENFPLRIGYWAWVAAGVIALMLAAHRQGQSTRQVPGRSAGAALADPVALTLLTIPLLNAALAVMTGQFD